ncbi:MAG TPA: sulfide/dihydroorotate dehydrogenase-like FAD/NAD-binding protein [bacterium]|nr:sulfide/dihydroorotate dehydrogenase-like FAD/NAD-binding protein [bacterium]HOL35512.1 sulfide/dihydroorotate dehydrogenase-like FAD/NAD-binding protein [bacterium]HPP08543.1 sulfide/dihydroorotate dehydrogenase-like FAD/NAD-binding protein [bacterium]
MILQTGDFNRIIEKKILSSEVKWMKIYHPFIAKKAQPGQFIIVRPTSESERIPLTLANSSPEEGTIEIIFQEVGTTTKKLGTLESGTKINNIAGPLGKPVKIEKFGRVLFVTGGVGSAFVYWMAKAFKEKGNSVWAVMGARSANLLILENEMRDICDKVFIATDDGSKGEKGFVTDVLLDALKSGECADLAICAGPIMMMKNVAAITREYHIKTIASLNPIMIDGTGMCGGCRVTVGGKVMFACVDGPDFDAHQVDFDQLQKRNSFYKKHEQCSLQRYMERAPKDAFISTQGS